MKIHEYQAAELFRKEGIPTLSGCLVGTAREAADAFRRTGGKAVLKGQALSGGRGKAGAVAVVESPEETEEQARRILKLRVGGYPVEKLLVVPACDIAAEFYLGITLDRSDCSAVLLLSAEGGIEIEELAASAPEKIYRIPLAFEHAEAALGPEVPEEVFGPTDSRRQAREITEALIRVFRRNDCTLAEINPLALDAGGNLVALDAKVNIDDNALFLHPDLAAMKEDETPSERYAREGGISFVDLDGDIGCIVNGAGLAMATMDMISLLGRKPANFLDVGGSSNPRKMVRAFEIITGNPRIRSILVNIFGGITRCDDVARGIIMAGEEIHIDMPVVIRLTGTNEAEGREILQNAGYTVRTDMAEAVQTAVKAVGGDE